MGGVGQKYCPDCADWYPSEIYGAHMAQHNVGKASYELNVKQYTGNSKQKGENYAICVLHQKKLSDGCPVKGCRLTPFGWIRKSLMVEFFKNGIWKWQVNGNVQDIPIDTETRIVILYGVPIKIRL